MSPIIIRQDITKMNVDAIINPTNRTLQQGGGVSGAIFKAAGAAELQKACDKLAPIETGEAVITPGFGLGAQYVIHTAGPVYRGGRSGEEAQLRACYVNSLKRALENGCESVAFPLIATGRHGYPKKEALDVARAAIGEFLDVLESGVGPDRHGGPGGHDDPDRDGGHGCPDSHHLDVYLTVFDKEAFTVSEQLMGELQTYIDDHYVADHPDTRRRPFKFEDEIETFDEPESGADSLMSYSITEDLPTTLDAWIDNLDESFSETLLGLIDAKGMTDVEVYKRANIDRRLFSKIRIDEGYIPTKRTILALAVAMRLFLEETDDLLKRAGHALSQSQKFDVIVQFHILRGEYDIFEINASLYKYDQAPLGI